MEVTETLVKQAFSPDAFISRLEAGPAKLLSKDKFAFHNWNDHGLPTGVLAVKLARMMGLPEEDVRRIGIAAPGHDIGLPYGRDGHEEKSAEITERIVRELGEKEEDIKVEKKIILGSKGKMVDGVYVYEPSDDIRVLIMRDADQANVGQENYMELSEALRIESGVKDKKAWIESQIVYLTKHEFFTPAAKKLLGPQKKKNLEYLQSKLRTDLSF